jgi:RimJ/RimL family protein N-acetyltransferase
VNLQRFTSPEGAAATMSSPPPVAIAWQLGERALVAIEPTAAEVAQHAPALALAYNDPHNAPMLGNTEELDADDVIDHFEALGEAGARQFLLFVDGELAGDADLRGLRVHGADDRAGGRRRTAEFAFMISAPAAQGQGLGTRFALMLHAFAFASPPRGVALDTVYASVVPANTASLRVFAKLGHAIDDTPAARAYADEPGDVVLAIDRATFTARHREVIRAISITPRTTG